MRRPPVTKYMAMRTFKVWFSCSHRVAALTQRLLESANISSHVHMEGVEAHFLAEEPDDRLHLVVNMHAQACANLDEDASYPRVTMILHLPGNVPLEMVAVPPGSFMMGSTPRQIKRRWGESWELPQHRVTIGTSFYLGKYPLTQGQWQAVMDANPSDKYGVGPDYPVYNISWNDVRGPGGLLERLNTHLLSTQQGPPELRLPSESEWEYACRAGSSTRFSFGNSDCSGPFDRVNGRNLKHYAWYSIAGGGYRGTHPVGQKRPNAFGLYDMHGNVCEWCEDNWHGSYDGAPCDGTAWSGFPDYRIFRGGAWSDYPCDCRSASRGNLPAGIRDSRWGARIAYGKHGQSTNCPQQELGTLRPS